MLVYECCGPCDCVGSKFQADIKRQGKHDPDNHDPNARDRDSAASLWVLATF